MRPPHMSPEDYRAIQHTIEQLRAAEKQIPEVSPHLGRAIRDLEGQIERPPTCEHRTTTMTLTDPPGPPICFHCGINTRTGQQP